MGSQVQPLYKFGYWVHDPKTNDVKNHWEHRDGDVVHGSYSLMQPDGHVRIVDYTVDKHSGFNAHVKYVYEGHGGGGGGAEGYSNGGGGGGGGFGNDFNNHLEDVSATGQSQIGGGGGHPKSLNKLYKKVRPEKPGGQPGQYRRPHHLDNQPKSVGGGKQQRLEYSAEHYTKPGGHFDQLPKFSSSSGNPFGYPGDDLGAHQPSSDHFARKYSAPASTDKSSHFAAFKHQSAERGLTHRRPDVAPAASTEHRQPSVEPHRPTRLQSASPSRVQRSHGDQAERDESTDDDTEELQPDEPHSFAKMQKQQFREYSFDEPPYPFEIPEMRSSIVGKNQKRHSHRPATTASSYFPAGWSGSVAAKSFNERPDDEFH